MIAGTLQIVDLLSGNALKYMSVFALGIMPYITASIILQLLTVVIPRLETLKNEGQAGQAKITQYTRYLTIGLAILQSTGYIELARSGTLFQSSACTSTLNPIIPDASPFRIATMVTTMVAGTAVIMWMGELITDDILEAFAVVCPLDEVAGQVRGRFEGLVDRFSFYAPYKIDPETWKGVLAGFHA